MWQSFTICSVLSVIGHWRTSQSDSCLRTIEECAARARLFGAVLDRGSGIGWIWTKWFSSYFSREDALNGLKECLDFLEGEEEVLWLIMNDIVDRAHKNWANGILKSTLCLSFKGQNGKECYLFTSQKEAQDTASYAKQASFVGWRQQ